MYYSKLPVYAIAIFLGVTTYAGVTNAERNWNFCDTFKDPVDILPKWKLNNDSLETLKPVGFLQPPPTLTVQGVCDYKAPGRYGIHINVTLPFINKTAEAPGSPEEVLPDSDEFEHIQVYFANEDKTCDSSTYNISCHRITEVRFNRFLQYRIRLLWNPYQVLRDDDRDINPDITSAPVSVDVPAWTGSITFESDLLPKDFNRIAAFIINPSQKQPIDRYYSTYRLYNHPISVIDLQVVTSYTELKKKEIDNIILEGDNAEYSSYWDGLASPASRKAR